MEMEPLIQSLKKMGILTKKRYCQAFRAIDRKDFVPEDQTKLAYEDIPLHIGHAQTISQPYTVAYMLELLEPREGDRILDVGSGSGWTTALLAHIAGHSGRVMGVEIIPDLVTFGQQNLAKYSDLEKASIQQSGTHYGLPKEAPFDKILVSAGTSALPQELVDQLDVGGTLVIPIEHQLWKVTKKKKGEPTIERHDGFAFVPLVSRS